MTPTCVVLDASASMGFPEGDSSKWAIAGQLGVALISVSHSGGDPAGLTVSGDPRATIPPRTRRGIVTEVMRALGRLNAQGAAPLAPCVISAARVSTRIAIVSDFLGDFEDTLRAARELIAAGRDVHALHIIASEEVDPPASVAVVIDPEIENVRRSLSGETRAAYVRAFGEWRDSVASRWLASGAAYRSIIVGREPLSHTVRRIVRDEPVMAHSA